MHFNFKIDARSISIFIKNDYYGCLYLHTSGTEKDQGRNFFNDVYVILKIN